MRLIGLACLFALAYGTASARTVEFHKKVNVSVLHTELAQAGFKVTGVGYDDRTSRGWVTLDDSEKKDPLPLVKSHVYVSHEQLLAARREKTARLLSSVKQLEGKLASGTITPAEKDELLLKLIQFVRLQAGEAE